MTTPRWSELYHAAAVNPPSDAGKSDRSDRSDSSDSSDRSDQSNSVTHIAAEEREVEKICVFPAEVTEVKTSATAQGTGIAHNSDDAASHIAEDSETMTGVGTKTEVKTEVKTEAEELDTLNAILSVNALDEVLLTDRGNGRRLAVMYSHILRYVADRDEWIVRRGPHWEPDVGKLITFALTAGVIRSIREDALSVDEHDVRDVILDFARKTEGEPARWRMISSAREHIELSLLEDALDAESHIVATPSAIVDLNTGKVRDATASDLCTMHTAVEYDPDAQSPELDRFLETFLPEPEEQATLWALLGTCLRGGNVARILPIIIGNTTCGKSQLVSALMRALGSYACSINVSVFRGNLDDKPRPDLVRAMKRRLAVATEASKAWELHADQVKRLTGGDAIPYRNLHEGVTEAVPRFTPLIVTNQMPRIKGADAALQRRLLVLRFTHSLAPGEEDITIKQRFINDEQCLRALFAHIVRGARSRKLRTGVSWNELSPAVVENTLSAYAELNHVDEFLSWISERDVMHTVGSDTPVLSCAKASDLHGWYNLWVKKHGDAQDVADRLSLKDFNAALRERGWVSRISAGTRWIGIKLDYPPSALVA